MLLSMAFLPELHGVGAANLHPLRHAQTDKIFN